MIRAGVDQLHHNADAAALGVFSAARESPGVYVYGANGDQTALAPDRVIASAVVDLPRALLLVTREIQRGGFVPHAESFGLGSGVIRFAVNPAMENLWPAGLKERIKAAGDSIAAGTLKVAGKGVP
jgi:basic membrane lipoprotein Med (substrate-binding protein (PBP1-ABC) superfamily)